MLMEALFIHPASVTTLIMDDLIIKANLIALHPIAAGFIIATLVTTVVLCLGFFVGVFTDILFQHVTSLSRDSVTVFEARECITIHSTPGEAYIPCYFGAERYADAVLPVGEYLPEAMAWLNVGGWNV